MDLDIHVEQPVKTTVQRYQRLVDHKQQSAAPPTVKMILNGRERRKIRGQHSPLAPCRRLIWMPSPMARMLWIDGRPTVLQRVRNGPIIPRSSSVLSLACRNTLLSWCRRVISVKATRSSVVFTNNRESSITEITQFNSRINTKMSLCYRCGFVAPVLRSIHRDFDRVNIFHASALHDFLNFLCSKTPYRHL